jgi:hypothetical protein
MSKTYETLIFHTNLFFHHDHFRTVLVVMPKIVPSRERERDFLEELLVVRYGMYVQSLVQRFSRTNFMLILK